MYSPPCMCTAVKKLRFKADFSLDLTVNNEDCEPWDLSLDHGQRKALRKCEQEKPWLLMASPPCTSFNVLPNLFLDKQDEGEFQAKIDSAIEHVAFALFICKKQAAERRMFALEHPASASSCLIATRDSASTSAPLAWRLRLTVFSNQRNSSSAWFSTPQS